MSSTPLRFLATCDDIGSVLFVCGETFRVAAAGTGVDVGVDAVDVPLVWRNDAGPVATGHGESLASAPFEFTLTNGFHSGPEWTLDVDGVRAPRVFGRHELGATSFFDFQTVEVASASALVNCGPKASVFGCSKVILLAPDAVGGRVRLGGTSGPLAAKPGTCEVDLGFDAGAISIRATEGIRSADAADDPERLPSWPPAGPEVRLPLPLERSVSLLCGRTTQAGPPFSVVLHPVP